MPFGVETYANSRRMEKSLRLQNADLLTEYNLLEADLARPKVKDADFVGKAAYLEQRARDHQPAMLCTLVMTDNRDSKGVARYPVGILPIMDPRQARPWSTPRAAAPSPHRSPTARPSARTSRLAICLTTMPSKARGSWWSISAKPTRSRWLALATSHSMTQKI